MKAGENREGSHDRHEKLHPDLPCKDVSHLDRHSSSTYHEALLPAT